MDTAEKLDTWGILEVMGHRRLAGKLSEQTIAGGVFLRIDCPQPDDSLRSAFYGAASIYAIHPCDEATARAVAAHHQPEPIQRWELLPPGRARAVAAGEEDDEDGQGPGLFDDLPGF